MSGRNRFSLGGSISAEDSLDVEWPEHDTCVFVSYRHGEDRDLARSAADYLMGEGLDVWFDEDDECLAGADDRALGVALCIERALDQTNALLTVTTPRTFETPWTPYEVGSARGRQQFRHPVADCLSDVLGLAPVPGRVARIAYLISNETERVRAFVRLGVPILDQRGLAAWAAALKGDLGFSGSRADVVGLPGHRNAHELDFDDG